MRIVHWSEEDQIFIGKCPELFGGGVHADDVKACHKELEQAIKFWVDLEAKGETSLPEPISSRKFSGKFPGRISEEDHRLLTVKALQSRKSFTSLVRDVLHEEAAKV